MTSLVIGASSVEQLEQNVAALDNLDLPTRSSPTIDEYAADGGIDLWRSARAGDLNS